jgi:hypothetical protein
MTDPGDKIGDKKRILPPTFYPPLRLGQVFGSKVDQVTKPEEGGKANEPTDRVAEANATGTSQEGSSQCRLEL